LRAARHERAALESEVEIKSKGGNTMKENASIKLSKGFSRSAIAVTAIGIALAGSAVQAKPNKGEEKPANVVAHVQLSGGPVTRMLLVKKEGKQYLLVGLNSTSGVAVFDVSNPDRPRTIDTASSATGAPSAEVKVVADTLTLFGSSDAGTASSAYSKDMRSFSGVTASLRDKSRGLIYVTNGDGLWIVKSKQTVDEDAIVDNYGG
jgi:hypothetical protein